MSRKFPLIALLAVLVLTAGCLGGGGDPTTTATTTEATTTATTTEATDATTTTATTTATTDATTTTGSTATTATTTTATTATTTSSSSSGTPDVSVETTVVSPKVVKVTHESGDAIPAGGAEVRIALQNDGVKFNTLSLGSEFGPGDVAWVYFDADGKLQFSVGEKPSPEKAMTGDLSVGVLEDGEKIFTFEVQVGQSSRIVR